MKSAQYLRTSYGYYAVNFDTLKTRELSINEIQNYKRNPESLSELYASLDGASFEQRFQKDYNFNNKAKIHILPSYNCNYHCSYCYEKPRKGCLDRLSPSQINHIKDFYTLYSQIFEEEVEYSFITVSGGEPFLPENRDVIATILQAWPDTPIGFITNGSHAQDYFPMLKNHSKVSLAFSIDGTREMHYKHRIPSHKEDYDALVDSIDNALSQGFEVQLLSLFHPELEHMYCEYFDLLEKREWLTNANLHLSMAFETNGCGNNDYSPKYLHDAVESLLRLKRTDSRMNNIPLKSFVPGCKNLEEIITNTSSNAYNPIRCYVQNSPSFTFLPNGMVSFCSTIDAPNGYIGSFGDTISINAERIRLLRNHIPENIEKCKSCNKRSLCRSECPATSVIKTNSYSEAYCGVWEDDFLIENIDAFL